MTNNEISNNAPRNGTLAVLTKKGKEGLIEEITMFNHTQKGDDIEFADHFYLDSKTKTYRLEHFEFDDSNPPKGQSSTTKKTVKEGLTSEEVTEMVTNKILKDKSEHKISINNGQTYEDLCIELANNCSLLRTGKPLDKNSTNKTTNANNELSINATKEQIESALKGDAKELYEAYKGFSKGGVTSEELDKLTELDAKKVDATIQVIPNGAVIVDNEGKSTKITR